MNTTYTPAQLSSLLIFKETLKIPFKKPLFIIFTFLSSLPLLCCLLMYENLLLQTMILAAKILEEVPDHEYSDRSVFSYGWKTLYGIERFGSLSHKVLVLTISYIGVLHFLDLWSIIATVNSTYSILSGDISFSLKQMFRTHLMEARLRGPLVTSIHVFLLTSLLSLGLAASASYMLMTSSYVLFTMLFVILFSVLLVKYLEWSAVLNLSMVVSVLNDRHGDAALVGSEYHSRGVRHCGTLIMLVSFSWLVFLRLTCFYLMWRGGGSIILIITVEVCLVCLANVFKWAALVVYYVNCKNRSSEDKVGCSGHAI